MARDLGDGYELDDAKERVDLQEVHRFLSEVSYWAKGRSREIQDGLIRQAARVVGLYKNGQQVGFCRAASDGTSFVYLADLYVLDGHRGRGLGEELVREMVENGPLVDLRWILHTTDMHPLYRKLGFGDPDYKLMERRSTMKESDSG